MRSRVHGTTCYIFLVFMLTPSQLKEFRKRAFELLLRKVDKTIPALIDYEIDSTLRTLYDLPERPTGSEPYVGWMVENKPPDPKILRTSLKGIDMIKRHEGLRTEAYLCPAKVWTIGYGHTGNVWHSHTVSESQAEKLLQKDLERFERAVSEFVKVPISQGQFDALVSFSFNVGTKAFKFSTLLRLLNQGKYREAGAQFGRWTLAKGSRLPGLIRRRAEEQHLFNES